MSISADTLSKLVAAGLSGDQLIDVVRSIEADLSPPRRTSGAERQRRYRERRSVKGDVTCDVTRDASQSDVTPPAPSLPSPPDPPNPPTPAPVCGAREARTVARLEKLNLGDTAERIWSAQPIRDGKRRSTRPDVAKALEASVGRRNLPSDIEAGCLAYYALPASRKDGGEFAMGAARLLERDRWREFLSERPIERPVWSGPAKLRAEIVSRKGEPWTESWLDRCSWQEAPGRVLTAVTRLAADRLGQEVGDILQAHSVVVAEPQRATA